MSRLNDLLRQLEAKDPSMAKELRKEYDALADRRAFGLNFERHTPESVELPGRKIRKGDKVHVLPERGKNPTKENSRLWRVVAIDRSADTATIEDTSVEPAETQEQPLTELVVVAEFRDPIYPGLISTGRIERGGDKPFHTVINAENYHALQTLLFTHRGQVDCIYIDPPYNTGNEGWIYNDKYVAGDDHYKHSKWLAFMERRILLAKELLKPTGVIIVAIGDEEHHRLRMLMDQVFEAGNFLANLTWQGNLKSDSRFSGGGTDYMLVYGRDANALTAADVRWLERKPGVDEVMAAGEKAFRRASGDPAEATRFLKEWWKAVPRDSPWRANQEYKNVDGSGRVFLAGPIDSPSFRANLIYEVLHPVTGRPVPTPKNGWRVSKETMAQLIADDEVYFKPNDTVLPSRKMLLERVMSRVPDPTFRVDRRSASTRLTKLLGDKRFPFPKDHEVLMSWIRMVAPPDAVVLDFFGGSGTTAEAVMQLNAEDDGTRQAVLITNNETTSEDAKDLRKGAHRPGDGSWESLGVFERVTKPRLSTVASGHRPDGSEYSSGLSQNIEFLTLTYEAPLRVASNREFSKIAPLLWMKAGAKGRRIEDIAAGWDVADTYGVVADLDQTETFLKAIAQREADGAKIRMVFVVTDEDRLFSSVCRDLPEHVEAVRLYEAYLRNFEIEAGRSTR